LLKTYQAIVFSRFGKSKTTFVLSPNSNADSTTLLKVLKWHKPPGILGGALFTIEVPENQRVPKRLSYAVIAKGVDQWTSEDDVKSELNSQGYSSLMLVERFIKRADGTTMPLCRLEFSNPAEAKKLLADGLKIGYCRVKCEEPRTKASPVQCYRCLKFGHRQAECEAEKRTCVGCGGPVHTPKGERCDRQRKCANCGGGHLACYKGCPKFKEATVAATVKTVNMPTSKQPRTYANVVEHSPGNVPLQNGHNSRAISESTNGQELYSKLAGFIGGVFAELFCNGFMLNKDPTRIGKQPYQDILDMVSSEASKHFGLSPDPEALRVKAGLHNIQPINPHIRIVTSPPEALMEQT
jgi:hypothetical protein